MTTNVVGNNLPEEIDEALDMLYDDTEDHSTYQGVPESILRLLTLNHVNVAPKDSHWIGRYNEPYSEVDVYLGVDGRYYAEITPIGD